MHISIPLTTLLATAGAVAVPHTHWRTPSSAPMLPTHGLQKEPIAITSYSLRKTNSTIQSVSFAISSPAQNVTCATGPIPLLPSSIVPCAGESPDSGFRFSLAELKTNATVSADPNQYTLTVFHGDGNNGKWGRGEVPTYCHAGGNGPSDFVCSQLPVMGPYVMTLRG